MFKKTLSLFFLIATLLQFTPALTNEAAASGGIPSTTASEVQTLFQARSGGQHPRVLANNDDFTRVRRLIRIDPYISRWYDTVYSYCIDHLDKPPVTYTLSNDKLMGACRIAGFRIINMAFVYQITGETRFAERAIEEILTVCSFSDWNPYSCLDVAQMAYGVGLGYDWLYEYMSQAQRNTICEALYKHAIVYAQTATDFKEKLGNWNSWSYGGLILAVAAIFESYPDECASLIAEAVENIPTHSMSVLAPAGSYPEGASYHRIGTEFTVLLIEALNTTLGTDFGLSNVDGFKETGKYLLAVNGEAGNFNFGDGSNTVQFATAPMLHWFANRYQMPELSIYQRSHQITYSDMRDEYLALLWYDPELVKGYSDEDIQKDFFLPSDNNISIAAFRSGNMGKSGLYAAIKDGDSQSNGHVDADVGTFVLDALGERWFVDLGSDDYSLPNYFTNVDGFYPADAKRWNYYRKRTEGQNTLVINPCSLAGQKTPVNCRITQYKSVYDGGIAVVDMTDAYSNYKASSVKRALMLFDCRSRVLLRDEVVCTEASEIYWFAHTQAEITLSADGKTATLTQKGKKLLAQIASPSTAVFTVMDAEPLPTSPASSAKEYDRSTYQKLAIHLTGVTSAEIAVVFTPVIDESDLDKNLPTNSISELSTVLNDYDPVTELSMNSIGEYEIYNAEQLMKFAEMVNNGNSFAGKTVKLMNDINLMCRSFTPIGGGTDSASTYGQTFKGTFDGCNHRIHNLHIYQPNNRYVAFFGSVSSATIKNLGIESGSVTGGSRSAGLVASAKNSVIESCYNKADVRSTANCNGGLVAQIGGNCTLSNCYNNCKVRGTSITGGIIGYIVSNANAYVTNCYHSGTLVDPSGRSGMIGFYYTDETASPESVIVTNCYSTEALKSSKIVDSSIEQYSNCSQISSAKLVSAAISLGSSFIYDCEWENDGYPVLTWQCSTTLPDDCVLTTAAQLRLLAYTVNCGADNFIGKTVRLGSDIDLSLREWVPIGGNSETIATQYTFHGIFDGDGHVIRDLCITTGNYLLGLFGDIRGATVQNVGVRGGYIYGADYVGGIAGRMRGSKIRNCFSSVMVAGNRFVGGIAGISGSSNNSVENCYHTGSLFATGNAGGIIAYCAGDINNLIIINCYHAGSVSGSAYSGGLIGAIHANAGTITVTNSYAAQTALLIGNGDQANLYSCSLLSEADMETVADVLGVAYADDLIHKKNNGYPLLAWETCDLLGHDYQYENNQDGTHVRLCNRCVTLSDDKHIYMDGLCVCGAVQKPLESQGVLMFDFTNDLNAKRKYADATYGGYNYDLEKYWSTAYSGVGNGDSYVEIDHNAGTLTMTLSKRTNGYGARLEPVGESNSFAYSTDINYANYLNFDPSNAEIFQIRLKLEGAVHYGNYKQGVYLYYLPEGAEKWSGASSPNEWKESFKCEIDDACLSGGEKEGKFVTLTASLKGKKLPTYSSIKGLWLQFNFLYGGTATIDYIYIGPAVDSAPKLKTVCFMSESKDRLLSEAVTYTTEASFIGALPVKASDAMNHYTFDSWVDLNGNAVNLSAIASSTTVYASFAANKHSYTYHNVDSTSHKANCSCGYNMAESHCYENGFCICGAVDMTEPTVIEGIIIRHSLSLASDISINYVAIKSQLDPYDSFYLECIVPAYSGNKRTGEICYILQPVDKGSTYYFTLDGLVAFQMNDMVYATLHLTKDGVEYVTAVDAYSIASYAYNQLGKADTSDAIKKMCANLLQYGSVAQTWKSYRMDALADATMTDAQKAYLTTLGEVSFNGNKQTLNDFENASISWLGNSLCLESKVVVRFIFANKGYNGDPTKLSMHISYTNCKGVLVEHVVDGASVYNVANGYYAFNFESLPASEMRSVLSAVIYDGETRISQTRQYSVDTYGVGKSGINLTLSQAMVAYGDAAFAMFSKSTLLKQNGF